MKREDKQKVVKDLHKRLEGAQFAALTEYRGLDVITLSALRKSLREAGAQYQVVKNTLLLRASEGTDLDLVKDQFSGPTAVALTDQDPVNAAKALSEFAKGNDKFVLKMGVLGGKLVDQAGIKALADLPSREVLLAQLLSAMNGVPTGLVNVLSGVTRNFMNVLAAIKEEKEKQAA